jgi:hypothetical protein
MLNPELARMLAADRKASLLRESARPRAGKATRGRRSHRTWCLTQRAVALMARARGLARPDPCPFGRL